MVYKMLRNDTNILDYYIITCYEPLHTQSKSYNSTTYDLISNGVGDMHCRGVKYLTDELLLEYGMMEQ